MTIKLVLIDPNIQFAVPIKRALEVSGDFKVNVFASGRAALELLQRESHDVAIIDFGVEDIGLTTLIEYVRRMQPWIFILATPRNEVEASAAGLLDLQGTLPKPYVARQLGPVIREAALARAKRGIKPEAKRRKTDTDPVGTTAPPIELDEFLVDEPPVPEGATLRDVARDAQLEGTKTSAKLEDMEADHTVPSKSTRPVQPVSVPETLPETPLSPPETEPESESPPSPSESSMGAMAEVALEISADDTVGLMQIPQAIVDQVETLPPENRPNLPNWMPASGDELLGLTVAQAPVQSSTPADSGPTHRLDLEAVFAEPLASDVEEVEGEDDSEGLEGELDEHLALSFSGLLPVEERQPTPPKTLDAQATMQAALSMLGIESEDELDDDPDLDDDSAGDAVLSPEALAALDPLAAMALQITQLTLSSAAQATLLTRGNTRIAGGGRLSDRDSDALVQQIRLMWEESSPTGGQSAALFRYIQLPNGGDYLMYSMRTVESMVLTMLFPGDVPLRTIRRQARALQEALEKVPEVSEESEAAKTLPSRPTELRPPEGLRPSEDRASVAPIPPPSLPITAHPDVLFVSPPSAPATAAPVESAPVVTADSSVETPVESPAEPPVEAVSPRELNAPYTFLWLPRLEEITPLFANLLLGWLHDIASHHGWRIDGTEIHASHVALQISLAADDSATEAIETIMRETALRQKDALLWAELYYIVPGGRAITHHEITSFIEYRRELMNMAG